MLPAPKQLAIIDLGDAAFQLGGVLALAAHLLTLQADAGEQIAGVDLPAFSKLGGSELSALAHARDMTGRASGELGGLLAGENVG